MGTQETIAEAVKKHSNGDLDNAIELYKKVYDNHDDVPAFYYANFASALRNRGHLEDARKVADKGLKLFSEDAGLLNNAGNICRDLKDAPGAIEYFRKCIEVSGENIEKSRDASLSLAHIYNEQNMPHLAFRIVERHIRANGELDIKWTLTLMDSYRLLESNDSDKPKSELIGKISRVLEKQLTSANAEDNLRACTALSHHLANKGKCKEAMAWYRKAEKSFQKVGKTKEITKEFKDQWTQMSWNISINLLRGGDMENGWRLYDYGLQVPADGRQKWQRSLRKPYSFKEVPILDDLTKARDGVSLLVIGEQGVGDSMMFARVAEVLTQRIKAKVTLALDKRLVPIYSRSSNAEAVMSVDTLVKNAAEFRFDYQIPVGSLCKLVDPYQNRASIKSVKLYSDPSKTSDMRDKYKSRGAKKPIIGISWQGGGRPDRVNIKSIKLSAIMQYFQKNISGVTWLSLQYGDDGPHLKTLKEKFDIDVIHDSEVEPLKDMDTWLSQVDTCDAVVTIANTTVHGAAGLGKPTFVLLSQKSDWRWIRDDSLESSYWYESVTIGEQSENGDWGEALADAVEWIRQITEKR